MCVAVRNREKFTKTFYFEGSRILQQNKASGAWLSPIVFCWCSCCCCVRICRRGMQTAASHAPPAVSAIVRCVNKALKPTPGRHVSLSPTPGSALLSRNAGFTPLRPVPKWVFSAVAFIPRSLESKSGAIPHVLA